MAGYSSSSLSRLVCGAEPRVQKVHTLHSLDRRSVERAALMQGRTKCSICVRTVYARAHNTSCPTAHHALPARSMLNIDSLSLGALGPFLMWKVNDGGGGKEGFPTARFPAC